MIWPTLPACSVTNNREQSENNNYNEKKVKNGTAGSNIDFSLQK